MTVAQIRCLASSIALAIGLTACGGGGTGGGGSFVNSTPPPPPAVPPPPKPPTNPGPIGLTQAGEFATASYGYLFVGGADESEPRPAPASSGVTFRYLANEQSYEIGIPGYNPGRLQTQSYSGTVCADGTVCNPSSTYNAVTDGVSTARQEVGVILLDPEFQGNRPFVLTYTSLGYWDGSLADPEGSNEVLGYRGAFAYGIPTMPGDVPASGTATYKAEVEGTAIFDSGTGVAELIGGTANLIFDFGAGTLAGHMEPFITNGWDGVSLGRYNFAETVYSTGATTFSGRFDVPGAAGPSSFEGRFNGPQSAELMARWNAPFIDPLQRGTGIMFGIWVGKKN